MYVLGIDEATTDTCRDIYQVELYYTSDWTPYLFIEAIASTLLGGEFQIDTRGQRHLVMTGTIVAGLVLDVFLFPVVEGCSEVWFAVNRPLIQFIVGGVVGLTHIGKMHVAGQ